MALRTIILALFLACECSGAQFLSTYVGKFYGNGAGLSNVVSGTAANVIWPVAGTNVTMITNGLTVTISSTGGGGPLISVPASPTNWPVSAITNAGTAAYSNATAFYLNSNPSNYATASVTNGLQGALGFTPLTSTQTTNAATGAATAATNGYPWGSLYDAVGRATQVTNGYPWGSLYDAAGTALNATNGLGSAAFLPSTTWLGLHATADKSLFAADVSTNQLPYTAISNSPWATTAQLADATNHVVAQATHATNADLASFVSGTLSNSISGSATTASFVAQSPLTNAVTNLPDLSATYELHVATFTNSIYASNVLSGGALPLGTVSTGVTAVAGPFLTTNTIARSYSYNAGGLSNLTAANITGVIPAANLPSTSPFTNAVIAYGDSNRTNAVFVGAGGETLSNALGSVTIASGNVTASGTITGNGAGVTNAWVREYFKGGLVNAAITAAGRCVPMDLTVGSTIATNAELLAHTLSPVGGYLTNLQVWSSVAWPSTTNIQFTIQTNTGVSSGVNTPITCTLNPSGNSSNTYTNSGTTSVVLPASQTASGLSWLLSIYTAGGANLAAQSLNWSVEWWHQSP